MTTVAITASKIALGHACPGAFALPHFEERHDGQDEGNERHADDEADINAGNVPDELVARWPGFRWRAEVAFAIDLATGIGREVGIGIDRAYDPRSPLEVFGTADAVGRLDDRLVIVDRKSFDPRVPRAAVNAQLHTLALAATRAYGLDACEVAIRHEARPLDVAALDSVDLDAFLVELRGVLARVTDARRQHRDGTLQLHPGDHCRYCPAFMGPDGVACPAQRALRDEVKHELVTVRVEAAIPFRDDVEAADAYELWQRIKMLSTRLGTSLHARANERPIPLGNGKVFGPRTKLGNEKLDGDVVYEVVKARHGQAIADAAVIRSATKTRLKSALSFAGVQSVAGAVDATLAVVRDKGGAKRETKTVVDEHEEQSMLEEINRLLELP
jgi:uncharacterized protein DUF2800